MSLEAVPAFFLGFLHHMLFQTFLLLLPQLIVTTPTHQSQSNLIKSSSPAWHSL